MLISIEEAASLLRAESVDFLTFYSYICGRSLILEQMKKKDKIFIAGHQGLVGSALVRALNRLDFNNLILRTRGELDLRDQSAVSTFFYMERPDYVFLAAARVGSILANIKFPADFIEDNIRIQTNVMHYAKEFEVKKLLFYGSNCMYPRESPQPMKEDYLYSGPLEPTNQFYAVAKLAGLELCRSYDMQYGTQFIVAVPASIYGQNDHFDPEKSHVISNLIMKFHEAKNQDLAEVILWGDGSPCREFIHCDDVAEASVFLMQNFQPNTEDIKLGKILINIGTSQDYSILELSRIIKDIVGYKGKISWDTTKPNGMPRKLLDSTNCNKLGWSPRFHLIDGIAETYMSFRKRIKTA